MQMTAMSKGLPLNSKYIKNGRKEGVFQDPLSSFPHTATFCNCLPCGLIIWQLSIYGSVATLRRAYLAACGFGLKWTRFTFAVNSFSGRGSAVVVSNCYQLAWISAISRSPKWSLQSISSANLFVALRFVTLLDFSGQDFILERLIRSYSRRLDFLEFNPYWFASDNKVDYSFHIITSSAE